MGETAIHSERRGRVEVIVIDHPPVNALAQPLRAALLAAVEAAESDPAVRALVIHGAGRHFVAGADIREFDHEPRAPLLNDVLLRIEAAAKPVIAALHGAVLGGGFELALACHYRVAAPDVSFGLPEIRLGLLPGSGGTQRLPRLIGRARAIDLILTARQMEAPEALAVGLVDRLVDAGGALDAALELAHELGRSSRPALLAALRSVDAAQELPLIEGNAFERAEIGKLFTDGEGREGIAAFVEKRRPEFS